MNTEQWLEKILSSKEELYHWLQRQYVGEVNAARKIHELSEREGLTDGERRVLRSIASDESTHANWVFALLQTRGIPLPDLNTGEERYWKPILAEAKTFAEIAAAGHHAEGMRLVRIRALSECEKIDEDIRNVFKKILPDEIFHEKAFGILSSPEAREKMRGKHDEGLALLGLEI